MQNHKLMESGAGRRHLSIKDISLHVVILRPVVQPLAKVKLNRGKPQETQSFLRQAIWSEIRHMTHGNNFSCGLFYFLCATNLQH